MEKALIYCRVSTEGQAEEGRFSLTTQRSVCEKAIVESSHYELAQDGIYEDPGYSARNMNRPALQNMLVRAQEDRSIKAVFVIDTDRIFRNAGEHLITKALLRKSGVELISVSQPGITNSPEGDFMDTVIAGVNQFQSQITGRKTKKSMEQKFHSGVWPTRVPVGYLNAGDPNNPSKRIVLVDEAKGSLIKDLFQAYSTGSYSMLELADEFLKKGLVSKTGGRLSIANLFRLIRNPFYYGLMKWNGLEKMGNHTPLIDKETFDACQRVCDDHNKHISRRRKYDFLLRGYIYSATSGLRFIGENHPNKNKSYYRPYLTNKQKPATIPEDDIGINARDLEIAIEEQFRGIQFSEEFVQKLLVRVQFMYDLKRRDVVRSKKKILITKAQAEQKLAVAEEKLISGVLDDADFTRVKFRQRNIIAECDQELAKLEAGKNIKIDIIQQVIHLAKNIGEAYKNAPIELKRVYLSLFWTRFEVSRKRLVHSIPSPILEALVASGAVHSSNTLNPVSRRKMFSEKNEVYRDTIRIRNLRGGYRELNPN